MKVDLVRDARFRWWRDLVWCFVEFWWDCWKENEGGKFHKLVHVINKRHDTNEEVTILPWIFEFQHGSKIIIQEYNTPNSETIISSSSSSCLENASVLIISSIQPNHCQKLVMNSDETRSNIHCLVFFTVRQISYKSYFVFILVLSFYPHWIL